MLRNYIKIAFRYMARDKAYSFINIVGLSVGVACCLLVAFIIAVPVSLYAINQWLENFAYKTPVNISTFILAGTSALLIAVVTVSFQSFKAASVNLVNSLRTE
jgi:putative ABC transport system permease protein